MTADASFDVLIVGAGIAGTSLGAAIAARRRVAILEAEPHAGFHATGRSAAFWLESYGGPLVAPLTAASRPFLANPPASFADRTFLSARGALHVSKDALPHLPDDVANRPVERGELELLVPGIRPAWRRALLEPGCADIDVAALHAAYLASFRRAGGAILLDARLEAARRDGSGWDVRTADGRTLRADLIVNAAGAWADDVAGRAGVAPLGIQPKRRTMVQLRVGRSGLKDFPLVSDAEGTFYFKGEGDRSVWLSPHDEVDCDACDAAPEEIAVAIAIDRFEKVVDWPVERVERSWAGLRSFAPDRVPVFGFDPAEPSFFWCAGQGGFGIQTAPAAAKMAAATLLGEQPDVMVAHIDPAPFDPGRFG